MKKTALTAITLSVFPLAALADSTTIEEEKDTTVYTFSEKTLPLPSEAPGLRGIFPDQFQLADLDGDRDLDLVVYSSGAIYWAENKGRGKKYKAHEIKGVFAHGGEPLRIADVDGDRHPDIIAAASSNGLKIYWNKGKAKGWKKQSIGDELTTLDVAVGDLDGDGKLDIVSDRDGDLYIDFNKGKRRFASKKIDDGCGTLIRVADFDGDGDNDIFGVCYGGTFALYTNEGKSFKKREFKEPGLDSDFTDIAVGDVDGDGDLDLVDIPNDTFKSAKISLWSNDGKGNFKRELIIHNLVGQKTGLGRDRGYVFETRRVFVVDVDRDGKRDIITVAASKNEKKSGLIWWKQSGNTWRAMPMGKNYSAGNRAAIGDINGDGRVDVVTTRNRADYENKSNGPILWLNKTRGGKKKR